MDNDLKQPNNRATRRPVSSARPTSSRSGVSSRPGMSRPKVPMTAEEKLKRSMRGLSYTSSGIGGLNNNSNVADSKGSARKKVGGVVLDLETIQGANKQKLETKGRRNGVAIMILSLLLVVSLVYLAIAFIGYKNKDVKPNCVYTVEGEASWVIEGGTKTEFRIPKGLRSDMMYLLESSIKIETDEQVLLSIEIKALVNGEEILIAGLDRSNENLIRIDNTNKFVYQGNIVGGETIYLFAGFDFSDAPNDLTSDNVSIHVTAYVEKI